MEAARQADQLSLGREDEQALIDEHLELGVLDQVLGVTAAVLDHLHQLAKVGEGSRPPAASMASASKP